MTVDAIQKRSAQTTIQTCTAPPTTSGGGGGAQDGINNILGFMGITAFWGFVFWSLIVWQAAKNPKTQSTMPFIAALAFVVLLVLGLFEPYTTFLWAIFVIIIVIVGLSKVFGGGGNKEV